MGKCLIFAAGGLICLSLALTIFLQLFQVQQRARAMTLLFLGTLPIFIGAYWATPADLGFLPDWLVEPIVFVDLSLSVFVYIVSYVAGVLQLYNLADRGFSLRIVTDIAASPTGLPFEKIGPAYSEGKGLNWMYGKRIQGLLDCNLCEIRDGYVHNTERGTRTARLFGWLRSFLRHPSPAAQPESIPFQRRSA